MNSHPCVCTRQPEIISAARIERLALQRVGVMKCSPNVAKCSLGEERDGFLLTSLSRHTDSLAFQFLLVPFQASKSPVGVLGALGAGEAPGAAGTAMPELHKRHWCVYQPGFLFPCWNQSSPGLFLFGKSCCSRGYSVLSLQLEQCWSLQRFPKQWWGVKQCAGADKVLIKFGKCFHL